MEELKFSYKKGKMYINLGILLFALLVLIVGIITLQDGTLFTNILFGFFILLVIALGVYKIMYIKKLDFFIRCTKEGIYTAESFVFCEWKDIKSIELKRYLGYQTLFFQIDKNIQSKLKPMNRNNKQYYCLPLADCVGKPKNIVEKIKNFK